MSTLISHVNNLSEVWYSQMKYTELTLLHSFLVLWNPNIFCSPPEQNISMKSKYISLLKDRVTLTTYHFLLFTLLHHVTYIVLVPMTSDLTCTLLLLPPILKLAFSLSTSNPKVPPFFGGETVSFKSSAWVPAPSSTIRNFETFLPKSTQP